MPQMRQRMAPDRDRLNPSLQFLFAQACIFFKQHARALQALEALLREQPDHPRAWGIAGFLYAEKGRWSDAIAALEHALALAPDDAATLFNLGFALQKAGRHEEAIARMLRAVELNPALDRAWYGLGISLIHCGRFHQAIERLTEAARLQPFNPFARYQLAAAWFKLGDTQKVRAEYRKLKTFDPKIAAHVRADFGVPRDPDEVD
jgi:tetratricopeptide (TPR) repeat protein